NPIGPPPSHLVKHLTSNSDVGNVAVKRAAYVKGSGWTALAFEYMVLATDEDSNGIWIETNALKLDGDDLIRDSDSNLTQANGSAPVVWSDALALSRRLHQQGENIPAPPWRSSASPGSSGGRGALGSAKSQPPCSSSPCEIRARLSATGGRARGNPGLLPGSRNAATGREQPHLSARPVCWRLDVKQEST
ncbi:hypothetical protein FLM9_380, partial [Candidatus Synechococcus spongiarum]